jgi:hypothetical protein
MVELQTEPKDRVCSKCGKTIRSEKLTFEGREVFTSIMCICNECADRSEARAKAKAAEAIISGTNIGWDKICPAAFLDTDPALLPDQKAMNEVIGWQYGPLGLILSGVTGLGKSRCLYLLLRRMALKEGRSVCAVRAADFGTECSLLFAEGMTKAYAYSKKLIQADVLAIDDLDKCRFSERVESELFRIIDSRTMNRTPIIVTLNANPDQLTTMMSETRSWPTIRRLQEFCNIVKFTPRNP